MYIREVVTQNRKTKTKYVSHRLVEAVRTEDGPRQRSVMHLGTLTLPKEDWPLLARVLEARLSAQPSLFEADKRIVQAADQVMDKHRFAQMQKEDAALRQNAREMVTVDVKSINVTESRSLGPELVAHSSWKQLGFAEILSTVGMDSDQISLAEGLVVGRLVAPGSDLATWRWLLEQTALPEMTEVSLLNVGKNAVYEMAELLLTHKETLERELRKREQALFPSQSMLFLFDLTNTYFEGQCAGNTLAKFGHSKEKRSDCRLVTLALAVDDRGFPLFSQVYGGNQGEPQTLCDVINQLEKQILLFPEYRPTVVMDRGIATSDNVKLLKSRQFSYIVVERRPVEKEYIQEFETARDTFDEITAGHHASQPSSKVYVKKVPLTEGCRILCLSEGRKQKEAAMDTLKERRFLEDIGKLEKSITKGSILLTEKVSQRIGRIKGRYPSIAKHFEIEVSLDLEEKKVLGLKCYRQEVKEIRNLLTGCYVLETSHENLCAEAVWRLYTTLTKVEDAFHSLKTDLGFRPVHHQIARRTEAHLFLSVLAYHLLISIEHQLQEKGDNRRWSTIKAVLQTHQRTTVILNDEQEQIHSLRISGTPETGHREIYTRLNVKDPLKRFHTIIGKRL